MMRMTRRDETLQLVNLVYSVSVNHINLIDSYIRLNIAYIKPQVLKTTFSMLFGKYIKRTSSKSNLLNFWSE